MENYRSPIPVFSFSRICILIKCCAVEPVQSVLIFSKMCRNPIYNDTNPRLMAAVNKILQVVRVSESAGRSVITSDLIAPGGVVGVFCNRHQLHVCIAHIREIGYQILCQFPVAQKSRVPAHMPFPGAGVYFIDSERQIVMVCFLPVPDPFLVGPFKLALPDDRRSTGSQLCKKCIRIRLLYRIDPWLSLDLKFVVVSFGYMRYKNFPDSLIMVLPHSMNPAIPVVERTYNADSPRGRCRHHYLRPAIAVVERTDQSDSPRGSCRHREMSPAAATERFNMSAHLTVRPVGISFSPQLQVQSTQQRAESIRILNFIRVTGPGSDKIGKPEPLFPPGKDILEKAFLRQPVHPDFFSSGRINLNLFGIGPKTA